MKEPKSILITGASGGIGGALARAYARPGVALALTGRNADRLKAIVEHCRAAGAEPESAVLDITDEAAVRSWVQAVDRRSPLDLVIANAGMTGGAAIAGPDETPAEVRRMMSVNFHGVYNTLYPVIPAMQARGRGQLALMASLAALRGLPYSPAYCASKAALKAYADALRARLRPSGIGVAVILAGFVDTPLSRHTTGPKPLQMQPERAALIVRNRLARGRSVIAFPFLLHVGTRVLAALPSALADRFLNSLQVEIRRYE
jgi:short-subunit dehydrogenase